MSSLREVLKYRNRAAMLREIASEIRNESRCDALRAIADDYDQMAAKIEADLRSGEVKKFASSAPWS